MKACTENQCTGELEKIAGTKSLLVLHRDYKVLFHKCNACGRLYKERTTTLTPESGIKTTYSTTNTYKGRLTEDELRDEARYCEGDIHLKQETEIISRRN